MHRFTFLLLLACGSSHGPGVTEDAGELDADALEDGGTLLPDVGLIDAERRPDAVVTDVGTLDARADAGEPTSGVPCGDASCEAPSAVCVVCPHEDFTDWHCLPADLDSDWPFRTAMEMHPFCGFPGVFVQCDGPEDCVREDQECIFQGGEWGYAVCGEPLGQVACRSDDDCEPGVRCGEIDPFGYFSPHFETLGWRPHACGGASSQASEFCDEHDRACEGEGFFDRASCLRTYDEVWDEAKVDCARRELTRDACERASASDPCSG